MNSKTASGSGSKTRSDFARDVLSGLRGKPKSLPSKYFYDERGDQLFQQIMRMPE
ncbi:MAG: L-histidine N(alpha)-methyltransferase, partial [Saprospiraceae bacterium]|nr:L-histidine N(alpha)-methyltransferase [Saprospiraceae bacterium]